MLVCVPVRYPLADASRSTLRRAVEIATDDDALLAVVHINLYQKDRRVTQKEFEREVAMRSTFHVEPGSSSVTGS